MLTDTLYSQRDTWRLVLAGQWVTTFLKSPQVEDYASTKAQAEMLFQVQELFKRKAKQTEGKRPPVSQTAAYDNLQAITFAWLADLGVILQSDQVSLFHLFYLTYLHESYCRISIHFNSGLRSSNSHFKFINSKFRCTSGAKLNSLFMRILLPR